MKAKVLSNTAMTYRVTLATIFVLMATLAWQTNTAKSQVVTDGLVSYWPLDSDSIAGGTAEDVWGENDGTINGDPQEVEGQVHTALEFDGVDDHIDCGVDASLDITDAFTFEFRIYPHENASNRHVISRGIWQSGGYWVQSSATDMKGGLYLYSNGVYQNWIGPADTTELNIWQHYVVTYDGKRVRIYEDGEFLNEAAAGGTIKSIDVPFRIAKYSGSGCFFDGGIDEVRVYDRALNEDEVRRNFVAKEAAVASSDKLALAWGGVKVLR